MSSDDAELETLLYPPPPAVAAEQRPVPDWAVVHRELRRPNVTLALLWEEYRGGAGAQDGFGYSWFCDLYREWVGRLKPTLRQVHTAGERVFVDFAGHTMEVIDGATGEIRRAEIFVGVLGASSYTFAEAAWTQSLPDWIAAARQHAGVHRRRAAPDRQRQFARRDHPGLLLRAAGQPHLRRHGVALRHGGDPGAPVQAARQGQGRGRRPGRAALDPGAAAQPAVLLAGRTEPGDPRAGRSAQRSADARLGHDQARALTSSSTGPRCGQLPPTPYEYADWKRCRVNLDYHVEIDKHFYSVPFRLLREEVEARITAKTVEIFHRGKLVAAHLRSLRPYRPTTLAEHMPSSHRRYRDWTHERILREAAAIGDDTAALVEIILRSRPHPEQGFRSCIGILGWRSATTPSGWMPPAHGRWHWAPAHTARSRRS